MRFETDLLYKFFAGENTPEETKAISAWLQEDETHKQAFERAYKLFVYSTIATKGMSPQSARQKQSRRRHLHRAANWAVAGIAGAAAAVAILFGVTYSAQVKQIETIQGTKMYSEAKLGKQVSQTLSDGTVVELNSGSRIEYPAVFLDGERRVKLSGEAVFQVTHDQQHPFIVETFAYDLQVLGTTFEVIANEDQNEFATTLIEGSIAINDKENGTRITTLEPNQRIYLDQGTLKRETLKNAAADLLWTNDLFSVGGIPFDQLMRKVERCYGVKISIDRDTLPENGYVQLEVYISEGVEHLLRQLQRLSDFTYYFDDSDGKYHIQ